MKRTMWSAALGALALLGLSACGASGRSSSPTITTSQQGSRPIASHSGVLTSADQPTRSPTQASSAGNGPADTVATYIHGVLAADGEQACGVLTSKHLRELTAKGVADGWLQPGDDCLEMMRKSVAIASGYGLDLSKVTIESIKVQDQTGATATVRAIYGAVAVNSNYFELQRVGGRWLVDAESHRD